MMLIILMVVMFAVLFACITTMAWCIEHNADQSDYRRAIAEDYVRSLDESHT